MSYCLFLVIFFNSFTPATNTGRLKIKAEEAFKYVVYKQYNQKYAILVDMKIHSGKNRLFVWDFEGDSVVFKGLCGHGCCDNQWASDETKENPKFSNVPESHCSSLGKYKIGARGVSSWGININYVLHGLENSNSKAVERQIVLHSWDMVSESEVYPEGTPEGWGCPVVSNETMRKLDQLIRYSRKPVLLWIYND